MREGNHKLILQTNATFFIVIVHCMESRPHKSLPRVFISKYVTGFEKIWLPHTQCQTYDFTRNELLAQYTIIFHCVFCSKVTSLVSVAAFPRPCVSLEWHFGTIRWSWLSCIGFWRAGQATKGWPMSVIFNLECCEHKKCPVGPQTGPLAFNCLRIPFCTPILSSPSTRSPPTTPITTTYNIITVTKKAAQNSLNFGRLKVIYPHNYS